jgi:hypothetical protein
MRPSFCALFAGLSCAAAVASACGGTAPVTTSSSSGGGKSTSTTTATTSSSLFVTTGMGGTGGVSGLGGDGGQPSDVYPAPHPDPPQVVDFGGPVLAAPRVVPVFFADDDPALVPQIVDFLGKVGQTQYWAACTKEYGVGALTAAPPVMLPEAAPATIDDSAIEDWLAAKLDADDPAFPAADENTIYALHYPATTTITATFVQGEVDQSCVSFGGYHDNITLDAAHGTLGVTYIVMPTCDDFDGLNGIDAVTAAESHELVETVTDPLVSTQPAYAAPDDAHLYWMEALGNAGEVGDMCAQDLSSFTQFPELAYVVQRTWSNASALAGHDPCVPPLPGSVYFNSAPELGDTVLLQYAGQSIGVPGVKVPVGHTRVIDLDLFSDAPTPGSWSVDVEEVGTSNLDLEAGVDPGVNGQKIHLAITALGAGPSVFMVSSYPSWDATVAPNFWVGYVNN